MKFNDLPDPAQVAAHARKHRVPGPLQGDYPNMDGADLPGGRWMLKMRSGDLRVAVLARIKGERREWTRYGWYPSEDGFTEWARPLTVDGEYVFW